MLKGLSGILFRTPFYLFLGCRFQKWRSLFFALGLVKHGILNDCTACGKLGFICEKKTQAVFFLTIQLLGLDETELARVDNTAWHSAGNKGRKSAGE